MSINILDSFEKLRALDSKNMLGSLAALSRQMEQIKKQADKLEIKKLKNVGNIVVAGMGGSALGAQIIKSVYRDKLVFPLEIINDYHLPEYIGKDSLLVVSSYSGNTEEPLHVAREAMARGAHLAIITSGGELLDFARENKIAALIFSTENNPCGSPRMGLGYSIVGIVILLSRLGILNISGVEIDSMIRAVEKYDFEYGVGKLAKDNLAKQLVEEIGDRSVWFAAAEHLSGNAHAAANQMNENGKRFAGYFLIPELNHHLLEGMINPKSNTKSLLFIFLESANYDRRIIARFSVTKQVLEKNRVRYLSFSATAKNKMEEACETLVFFSYVSYYNAILNGIDPVDIPFVNFFKEQLKK